MLIRSLAQMAIEDARFIIEKLQKTLSEIQRQAANWLSFNT
jgi:hypothetical protein